MPPAQQAFARSVAAAPQLDAVFPPLAWSEVPFVWASKRTRRALTASCCGAKPWSEEAKTVVLAPRCERDRARSASAPSLDESLANRESAVGRPVALEVVEVRVRRAVDLRRGDEPHELVRELVGHREADEGDVGVRLERAEDEVEHRIDVGLLEVEPLLDVGLLVDDPRLERREVGRDRGREVVRDVLLEVPARQRRAGRDPARRDHARDRGEVELELGEVAGEVDQLDVEAGGLARAGADQSVRPPQLDLFEIADGEVDDGLTAVLRVGLPGEQDVVVAAPGGVDEDVVHARRVLRGESRGDGQRRLLRGQRARGDVRPSARVGEARDLIREPERSRARLLLRDRRRRQHAARREEVAEVDGRARDARVPAADPLDLRHLLPRPLRGRLKGVRLEDACVCEAGPAGKRRTGSVEGVVRRAVLARPRSRRERVPADARVGREALREAVRAADAARQ